FLKDVGRVEPALQPPIEANLHHAPQPFLMLREQFAQGSSIAPASALQQLVRLLRAWVLALVHRELIARQGGSSPVLTPVQTTGLKCRRMIPCGQQRRKILVFLWLRHGLRRSS